MRWRLRAAVVVAALVATPAAHAVAAPPEVTASSYVLVDPRTGDELAARSPSARSAMASTTKIMTALLALERAKLDDIVTVPASATIGGTTAGLGAGEQLTVGDLLTALMVGSGNDSALALAEFVSGSEDAFVEAMNARASELGLRGTRFANPHGLDEGGHYSTARDLVTLAREAMKNEVLAGLVDDRRASIPGRDGSGTRNLVSKNDLLDLDPSADGVKTGFTNQAGHAIVARSTRRGVGSLYLALLGSSGERRRAADSKRLLDWGFRQFSFGTLLTGGRALASVQVLGTGGERVELVAKRPVTAPLRVGTPVTRRIIAPASVKAPVARGQEIGTIEVLQGERVIGKRLLVAARAVDSPSRWERLRAGLSQLSPF
ncbi:MAG: D-alanyl-D-alanine carboxypeptidase [Thermoleophilia bacterium]|nr:D-alanyl-D-alanine carboxypeptidase [Thermoleophilia bacterium]